MDSAYLKNTTPNQLKDEFRLAAETVNSSAFGRAFFGACLHMGLNVDFINTWEMVAVSKWMEWRKIPIKDLTPDNKDFFTAIAVLIPRDRFMEAMSNLGLKA